MKRRKVGEEERMFGNAVRKLRIKQRFSQEAFADHAGVDRSYQGRIERGEVSITLGTVVLIAKGLGLLKSELMKKVEEES